MMKQGKGADRGLSVEERFELIKRNTSEIIGENELKEILEGKKEPKVYLGTAITGSPHVAYFTWAIKLADFAKAGFKVTLLLADLHGALDSTPWWDILERRYQYYAAVLPLMFEALGVKRNSLEFVKGSSFELEKEYFQDLLKLATFTSVHDCIKAASEVVKLGDNPKLGGLLYPLMQALDEEYLGVDVQYGGADQRKIFVLAGELLPKIGYRKRVHVMTPILRGLIGTKMSASVESSKIDFLDDAATVDRKIGKAECAEGDPQNGLMDFLRYVLFIIKKDKSEDFVVERTAKYGGTARYTTYEGLEEDFVHRKLHPQDLKQAVAREINALLMPVRKQKAQLEALYKEAYAVTR